MFKHWDRLGTYFIKKKYVWLYIFILIWEHSDISTSDQTILNNKKKNMLCRKVQGRSRWRNRRLPERQRGQCGQLSNTAAAANTCVDKTAASWTNSTCTVILLAAQQRASLFRIDVGPETHADRSSALEDAHWVVWDALGSIYAQAAAKSCLQTPEPQRVSSCSLNPSYRVAFTLFALPLHLSAAAREQFTCRNETS